MRMLNVNETEEVGGGPIGLIGWAVRGVGAVVAAWGLGYAEQRGSNLADKHDGKTPEPTSCPAPSKGGATGSW